MTRMRFCTLDGIMEFKAKGKLSNAPGVTCPGSICQPATCRFGPGHRPLVGTGPENYAELLALDSGCCGAVI
jgi:bis(5'-nucleosyl)-tetraphosphatase (symmetrical)